MQGSDKLYTRMKKKIIISLANWVEGSNDKMKKGRNEKKRKNEESMGGREGEREKRRKERKNKERKKVKIPWKILMKGRQLV